MKLLIVNPNSTHSMTEKMYEASMLCATETTQIMAVTVPDAPASIQGYLDIGRC